MAGDPISAVVLLGLGYENFSMSASSLLRVKSLMLQISHEMADDLVEQALCLSNGAEVVEYMARALEPFTYKSKKSLSA